MEERFFNVLYEPWILVYRDDNQVEEVSVLELFEKAQDYKGLAGEIEVQNAALMRFLLAILYTVFLNTDEDGNYISNTKSEEEIIEIWKRTWDAGKFPAERISKYLKHYEDRFWLFDPEWPLWQSKLAKIGTEYKTAKLYGDLSESSNKVRLFQTRAGEEKNTCSFSEAARWLLYINGYDDTSAKSKRKGAPSPGAGWLGRLGQIYAAGNSLFETLMLNLILLQDGKTLWPDNHPVWERKKPAFEREEISVPDNPAALLTLQSRWLLLKTDGERVTGFNLLGGEFFNRENAFIEPYTLWRGNSKGKKKAQTNIFTPRRHDASRQIWRDFSNIFPSAAKMQRQPGIVSWVEQLKQMNLLPEEYQIIFTTCGVTYGDKDFFAVDTFGDSVKLHTNWFQTIGRDWWDAVNDEISNIDLSAFYTGILAKEIAMASGAGDEKYLNERVEAGRQLMYDRINESFRIWLENLDPENQDLEDEIDKWRLQLKNIGYQVCDEIVDSAPDSAIIGRFVKDKDSNVKYSISSAAGKYRALMKKLYSEYD